jgi:hypothetical protein
MAFCTSPSSIHDNSTENSSDNGENKLLLSQEEEDKWRNIHNDFILKMKQKVQAAKKSRFQGFLSPGSLNNTINKVRFADFRITRRERLRSVDVQKGEFCVERSKIDSNKQSTLLTSD